MRPSSFFWLALLCLIVGLCAHQGGAQAPAPVPDCNTELISLLPCLDYVQGNVSAPPQNCCVGLGSVVKSNPICLCALFNSSALPIQVNTTRALQLPALCNVATPNPSICGGSVAPVQAPTASPPVSTPTAPTTPPTATATPPAMVPSAPATPSMAPSTPMTPSMAPSVAPVVAPSVAPVVAPSAPTPAPAAAVPAPSPMAETPVPTPMSAPAITPTGSVSSPPAPPPATDIGNSAVRFVGVSLLSIAIVVSSILFLQL